MTAISNRRLVITLFSSPDCILCHRVRLMLAEKGIEADIVTVDPENASAEFLEVNPAGTLPTLLDRELVLYDAQVIVDYLDERYPHPPFMPLDPVSKARTRMVLSRIVSEWDSLLPALMNGNNAEKKRAAQQLCDGLVEANEVFAVMPFYLSEEFSVLDVALAPLLWRLRQFGVDLPSTASAVANYASNVFSRAGFQASLSGQERELA